MRRLDLSNHQVKVTPFQAGLVLGLGAALVQAYFKVIPPMANGFCMVCHPKDLFNWVADHLFNLNWGYSMASTRLPLLTVVGVALGALVAAYQHGELHLRPARQPLSNFVNGFLMINFGLILGACPIRIVLLSAYGSYLGLVGWACIVIGVLLATSFQRWNASRSVDQGKVT
jgi:hypothetical protein